MNNLSGKMSLAASNARAMLTFWTDTIFTPALDHPVWDTIPPPLKEENYANTKEKRIMVYPNPGNGSFVLEANLSKTTERETGEVILYDLNGKMIDNRKYDMHKGGKAELDYRHCRPGVYILEVRSGRDVERTRLVIIN